MSIIQIIIAEALLSVRMNLSQPHKLPVILTTNVIVFKISCVMAVSGQHVQIFQNIVNIEEIAHGRKVT